MILEEPHEECNITLDIDAITEIDIPTTDEVTNNVKDVELESNGFETIKESETIHIQYIDQNQTILCQGSEKQHKESYSNPTSIATTKIVDTLPTRDNAKTIKLAVMVEQDKESCRAPANATTKEANYFFIDMITQDKYVENEKDKGKNSEKTKTIGADEKPLTSYPALKEQNKEPHAYPYIIVQT